MTGWTTADIPAQTGRLAIVTGASGGIGYATARALLAAGAEVVLASHNEARGAAALARLREACPGAAVRFARLDLAAPDSVAGFAAGLLAAGRGVDLLVNNAAVMGLPRRLTGDGLELQFATNYLGHFALTALLLPLLRRGARPRVVSLSSLAAWRGAIGFDNLQGEHSYAPMRAYAASKLATLIFALELQRRSDAVGWGLTSIAAHPGVSNTNIITSGPAARGAARAIWRLAGPFASLLLQPAEQGALPVLYAATSPDARGGGYYGPAGPGELRGRPAPARIPQAARDEAVATRLWRESERLAGVAFATEAAAPA